MRKLILFLVVCLCAAAQATTPPALPQNLVGIGPSWMRGAANPYNVDVNLVFRAGQTRFYSYTTISTPITRPAPGAQPVASSIVTGGAYVPLQNASGSVSLVFIAKAGFSAVQVNSTIAPTFSGSIGVAFRLGKSIYLMPSAKGASAATATSSSGLASVVLQPGLQLMYSFGGGSK